MGLSSNSSALTNITDCASDDFFNSFRLISHQNTLIYDEVFKCLPSDNILNFDDLKNYTKLPSLKKSNPVEVNESFFL
jgi:phospholipase D1/2